ncbi:serine/threonine-protein kinase [Streptomyces sp. NPDC048558]|uniref:serine/threonine-protein kinase n=1 Tax=Streptomyces sp. NPDC048558 TaxID=3155759 RepID=UPI0034144403
MRFLGHSGRWWEFDEHQRIGEPSHMGTVYRGWSDIDCSGTDTQVAVKRVRDITVSDREVEINAILSAENSTRRLNHVLVPLDHAVVDDTLLIVMPLADESLSQAMVNGTLPEADETETILQIARGLEEIHSLGILHRDLRAANVLRLDGRWVIADFGISRDTSRGTAAHTFRRTGHVAYMAPERWDEHSASVRSDLYSLGVLAYEILAGQLPFQGPENIDFRDQHLNQSPNFSALQGKPLGLLVRRLLEKDPNRRPEDARSTIDMIRQQQSPLTEAQKRLAEKLLGQPQRDSTAQFTQLRSEAFSELIFTVKEARESVDPLFDFTFADSTPTKCWLTIPGGRVMFEVWQTPKGEFGEDVILAGTVHLYKIASKNPADPRGNIICQSGANGQTWSLLQFEVASSGLSESYELGSRDKPHGFSLETFRSEQPHLASTPLWRMNQKILTSDIVLELVEDLIDRF